jgi:hypothetical protein
MALLGIAVAAVVAGALIGASTNAVKGAVSPTYFINVMGWQSVPNVWQASIVQGVIEVTFPSNGGQADITQFWLASNASGLR